MTIPRRIRIDLMVPEEIACREAIIAIEKMPHAHPLLTEAQALIAKAQARLADFIDRDDPSQQQFVGYPRDLSPPTADSAGEDLRALAIEALEGVIRVADRKMVEFDAARATLEKLRGEVTKSSSGQGSRRHRPA